MLLIVCVQVLADKTVVLATNQLQFVSMADVVVVMRGGSAVEVGGYTELIAAGGVFAALMKEAQVGGQGLRPGWISVEAGGDSTLLGCNQPRALLSYSPGRENGVCWLSHTEGSKQRPIL